MPVSNSHNLVFLYNKDLQYQTVKFSTTLALAEKWDFHNLRLKYVIEKNDTDLRPKMEIDDKIFDQDIISTNFFSNKNCLQELQKFLYFRDTNIGMYGEIYSDKLEKLLKKADAQILQNIRVSRCTEDATEKTYGRLDLESVLRFENLSTHFLVDNSSFIQNVSVFEATKKLRKFFDKQDFCIKNPVKTITSPYIDLNSMILTKYDINLSIYENVDRECREYDKRQFIVFIYCTNYDEYTNALDAAGDSESVPDVCLRTIGTTTDDLVTRAEAVPEKEARCNICRGANTIPPSVTEHKDVCDKLSSLETKVKEMSQRASMTNESVYQLHKKTNELSDTQAKSGIDFWDNAECQEPRLTALKAKVEKEVSMNDNHKLMLAAQKESCVSVAENLKSQIKQLKEETIMLGKKIDLQNDMHKSKMMNIVQGGQSPINSANISYKNVYKGIMGKNAQEGADLLARIQESLGATVKLAILSDETDILSLKIESNMAMGKLRRQLQSDGFKLLKLREFNYLKYENPKPTRGGNLGDITKIGRRWRNV